MSPFHVLVELRLAVRLVAALLAVNAEAPHMDRLYVLFKVALGRRRMVTRWAEEISCLGVHGLFVLFQILPVVGPVGTDVAIVLEGGTVLAEDVLLQARFALCPVCA